MQNKKLLKKINIWVFIIPFFIISILFSIGTYSSVERKISENYDRFKEDAIDVARNYSYSLKKSVAASRIINQLLEEKLIAASKTVMLDSGRFSQAEVKALAASLNVDQICVYNKNGVIAYSNIDSYVGWKAEEGHPVHNFIKSGKKEAMDEIRADSVSGEYYKYAYYRLLSGEFVQIGISAGDVKKILGGFEISTLLEELNEDPNMDQVSLINMDQIIVESSKQESKGTKIDIPEAALSISEGKEISYVDRSGEEVLYNSFIPLIDKGAVVGALFVSSQQREAAYFAAEELKNSIWLLATVFIATGGIMLMVYRNGRNYLRLAYYDTNTELPNQESLKYFLENLLRQKKWRGAIFMLNFSHLANLSLLYGYEYSDKVFTEIAEKVKEKFDDDGITFRIASDRLVIYSQDFSTNDSLARALESVKELFKKETFSDQNIYMPVEIGIAELGEEEDPTRILKKALIAMSRAKEDGLVTYQYFNSEMEAAIEREDLIEKEIIRAIDDENNGREGGIFALFQPQVEAGTGKVTGFETLARMKSHTLGSVSPVEFIEIAEKKRLITPLTKLIMKKTSIFIKTMKERSGRGVRVAVNISGADLMRSDFIEDMTGLIDSLGIEKSDLEFEITESLFMDDFVMANEKLEILRNAGILISLDDFGTGFSSLSRLRDLNVDIVKIDKMFVDNILVKKEDELIIPDIISMAHKTGLKVIAEGVETEAQRNYLVDAECDTIQGYFFSKPLATEEAVAFCSL
ncbi:MAG: bifunctional diguanylate cyclase/phosphodiesterase [Synergistota bacterium]|nr:bifunctional diguanylate cyclase/phosphodiesterase [Synergistota bacterium]